MEWYSEFCLRLLSFIRKCTSKAGCVFDDQIGYLPNLNREHHKGRKVYCCPLLRNTICK